MEPASQAVSYRRSHEQKKGQQMTSPRILKLRMRKQTRNKKKTSKPCDSRYCSTIGAEPLASCWRASFTRSFWIFGSWRALSFKKQRKGAFILGTGVLGYIVLIIRNRPNSIANHVSPYIKARGSGFRLQDWIRKMCRFELPIFLRCQMSLGFWCDLESLAKGLNMFLCVFFWFCIGLGFRCSRA